VDDAGTHGDVRGLFERVALTIEAHTKSSAEYAEALGDAGVYVLANHAYS
jgi:hypothetical protein